MSDLICSRCGLTASHADANIADLQKSCQIEKENEFGEYTVSAKHDWRES